MGKKGFPVLTFLLGSLVGAAVALLYAPMSGEELRSQIREEADVRVKKATEEWNRALENMQKSLDETSADIRAYLEQLSAKSADELEEEIVEAELEELEQNDTEI